MTVHEIIGFNRKLKNKIYTKILLESGDILEIFNAIKNNNEFIEHNIYVYLNGELDRVDEDTTKLKLGKYINKYGVSEILVNTDDLDIAYSAYKNVSYNSNLDTYFGIEDVVSRCDEMDETTKLGGGTDKIEEADELGVDELASLFGTKIERVSSKGVMRSIDEEFNDIINSTKEFISKARELKLKEHKNFADSVIIQKAVSMQNILNKITNGCDECKHTGYVTDDETGISVQCDCVVGRIEILKRQLNEIKVPNYVLQNKVKMAQLLDSVIPRDRQDDEFSKQIGNAKIVDILKSTDSRVVGAKDFLDQLGMILSEIALGVIKHSYILGAPNGFGKTTFVYTGIKRLMAQGKKVVPYKSLTELAQIKIDYERNLLNQFKYGYKEKEGRVDKGYTWQDYLDADVLFTYLSTPSSGELESAVLSSLMSIRGTNGKPTIVMVASSLKVYTVNTELYKYYWCDILCHTNEDINFIGTDRLIHYSCYITQKK